MKNKHYLEVNLNYQTKKFNNLGSFFVLKQLFLWYNKFYKKEGDKFMKVLVISDIHGSGYYADKIKEINERENPEKIILLGDLILSWTKK